MFCASKRDEGSGYSSPVLLRGRPRPLFGSFVVAAAVVAAVFVSETALRGRPRPRLGPSAGLGIETSGCLRGRPRLRFSPVWGVAAVYPRSSILISECCA